MQLFIWVNNNRTLLFLFDQITEFMAGSSRNGQHLKAYEYFLCGAATGFIVAFIEGPIDLVSVVMYKCTVS